MPFNFKSVDMPDLILVEPKVFVDERGCFIETFKQSEFQANGINYCFVQDNHSKSMKGVLRGLHYQLNPKAQGKLVRCIRGRIWDVAVDIRKNSPFFGKWFGCELSEQNNLMLWIPPGFAHGFLALDDAEIIYKNTAEYDPSLDAGIIWNDPDIKIDWGINSPILSRKDSKLPTLKMARNNFI